MIITATKLEAMDGPGVTKSSYPMPYPTGGSQRWPPLLLPRRCPWHVAAQTLESIETINNIFLVLIPDLPGLGNIKIFSPF